MFKRISLLAVMALSVIAVAAPAAQAQWLHNGSPLESNAEISLSGKAKFVAPGGFGSFECEVNASVTAEPGSTATVTSFAPVTSSCVGAGFLFSGCELESHSATVPWEASVSTGSTPHITIKKVTIHNKYKKCTSGTTTSHLVFEGITAAPDNHNAIKSLLISGTATNGAVASGTLNVVGGAAGTYGLST